jgi:hypothetical protein
MLEGSEKEKKKVEKDNCRRGEYALLEMRGFG